MRLARLFVPALLAASLLFPALGLAAAPESLEEAEAFVERLDFKHGTVKIAAADATLNLGPQFRFLAKPDARRVLEDLWGNPPDDTVLGLVVPDKLSLLDDHAWAVVVSYSDDGYISDEEAAEIDYDQMLKDMKDADAQDNIERKRRGYDALHLIGWAEAPHYDQANKKLYWAKELKAEGADGNTVNYDIRVLGRKGYLSLNAIAAMDDLPRVRQGMKQLLPMAEFDQGQRYADYNPSTDKLAGYGLAALVGGGLAAKAGLFGKIGLLLVKAWKLVLLACVGLAGLLGKLFARKKKDVVS